MADLNLSLSIIILFLMVFSSAEALSNTVPSSAKEFIIVLVISGKIETDLTILFK